MTKEVRDEKKDLFFCALATWYGLQHRHGNRARGDIGKDISFPYLLHREGCRLGF